MATSKQVGGDHYAVMKKQPMECIRGNEVRLCEGNVSRCLCRYKGKNGVEDLKKARQYLDLLIERESR